MRKTGTSTSLLRPGLEVVVKSFVVVGSMGAVGAEVVVGAVVGSTLLQSVNLISSIPKTDFLKTLNENYILQVQI